MTDSQSQSILVIGSGELGTALLMALSDPEYRTKFPKVSLLTRKLNANVKKNSAKEELINVFVNRNVNLVYGDVDSEPEILAEAFRGIHTVIMAVGYNMRGGNLAGQTRVLNAAVLADVKLFIPWEFGFDYGTIGRGSVQPLFDEKLILRELIKQTKLNYIFISTGIFTDFLFDPAFGIVDYAKKTVKAPIAWDNKLTCTSLVDIGKCVRAILINREAHYNQHLLVAGDTVNYRQVKEIVEDVFGSSFDEKLTTENDLISRIGKDPNDIDAKYQLVMAKQTGIHWSKDNTYNSRNQIPTLTASEWAHAYLKEKFAGRNILLN